MNKKIITRIASSGNVEAVKKFFTLLSKLLLELGIDESDKRLVLNVRNDYRQRFSVNINSYLAFSLAKMPDGLLKFQFLVRNAALKNASLKQLISQSAELTNKDYFLVDVDHEKISDKNIDLLLSEWLSACKEYLPMQTASQYRIHHIPALFEMAQKPHLLEQYMQGANRESGEKKFEILQPGQVSYLKYLWKGYQESVDDDFITDREQRLDFQPVARQLIQDLLIEHPAWGYEQINALNQLLKLDPSAIVVKKYLSAVFSGNQLEYYSDKFKKADKKGITTLGLNGFDDSKVSLNEIELVRTFLSKALSTTSHKEGLEVIQKFEKLKIGYVKKGVFSPWLFFINPKLFPFSNGTHEGFLKHLGSNDSYERSFSLQHEILKALDIDDFGHLDAMILWYGTGFPKLFRVGTTIGASGESIWPEMLEHNVASIGWSDVGDLTNADSIDKKWIIDRMEEEGYEKDARRISREAGEILSFYNDVIDGDFILACKGQKIKGIGQVIGDYQYRNDLSFSHTKEVRWLYQNDDGDAPKLEQGIRTSVYALSFESDVIYSFLFDKIIPTTNMNSQIPREAVVTTKPSNSILHGPPGTGKTYSTKAYALSLLQDGTTDHLEQFAQLRDNDKAAFNNQWLQHKQSEQVEFVTFHQSFSYEDFVQGIRPNVKGDGIKFQLVDGLFKAICTNALFEYYKLKWNDESTGQRKWSFDELWLDFSDWVLKKTDDPFPLESKSGGTIYLDGFSNYGNFRMRHENGSRRYTVSMFRMNKIFNAFNSVDDIKNIHNDIRSVIGGANTSSYWAVFNALKKFELENTPSEELTFDDLESYDDNERKKRVQNLEELRTYSDRVVPQYVLIIDEINRANISRVLGELITLLEPDKRLGQPDELIVKLPSGEPFAVPPNLHIIGTMNTADKSIAHLDVALRRRFKFIPAYPDSTLVKDEQKREVLKKLNRSIVELSSPDLTIGHSYFMNDEDITPIMNHKVIPLLTEYFDQRSDEIKSILEDAGLTIDKNIYGQLTCTGYNKNQSEAQNS